MNEVNKLMENVLTLRPNGKVCIKAFHDDPNIETLKKCEEALKIRLMNFIVGDISYNGPKEVDFSDTAVVYNYVRYFFNIDLMILNAARSSEFWVHVLKLLTKDKEHADGENGKGKNAK